MQTSKDESQQLMDAALPFAEKMLAEEGTFFPYACAMTPGGEIVAVKAFEGNQLPESSELLNLTQQALVFGASKREFKATALIYNVTLKEKDEDDSRPTDAIAVNLDHQSGYSIVVFLPYSIKDGKLEFGEMGAEEGEGQIFKQVHH